MPKTAAIAANRHQSDGLKKSSRRSLRKSSGKQSSGQPGHQAVYFNQYQFVPQERVGEIFGNLYGYPLGETTVLASCKEVEQQVTPVNEQVKAYLIQQEEVVNFDETGARVSGALHWLYSTKTALLTYYTVHAKRGSKALREICILPNLNRIPVHDKYTSHFQFEHQHYGLCNTHHLWELKFIKESYQQNWASQMATLLLEINREVVVAKSVGRTSLLPDQIAHFEAH